MSQTFVPNTPNVSHENFDGEVVLVSFESGCYYSLRGSGAALWERLTRGASEQELVAWARSRYLGDELGPAVVAFLARLVDEKLVVVGVPSTAADEADAGPPEPFVLPQLEVFSDMQELLWLDPIHDVDAQGWPVPGGAKSSE